MCVCVCVEEFINWEETLEAMSNLRQLQKIVLERKRKEFRKTNREEQKPAKKFKDYDFTPLNVGISKVLTEINKDPEFHRPPKIPGNPPRMNKDKYCEFHELPGHYSDECIALRLLIEKFIKNGKLVRFMGEYRNRPWNDGNN